MSIKTHAYTHMSIASHYGWSTIPFADLQSRQVHDARPGILGACCAHWHKVCHEEKLMLVIWWFLDPKSWDAQPQTHTVSAKQAFSRGDSFFANTSIKSSTPTCPYNFAVVFSHSLLLGIYFKDLKGILSLALLWVESRRYKLRKLHRHWALAKWFASSQSYWVQDEAIWKCFKIRNQVYRGIHMNVRYSFLPNWKTWLVISFLWQR